MGVNELNVGRYNGILTKLLDIKGTPAPTLSPEIVATLPLEVARPEWAFLGGERLCAGHGYDAATAAEYSNVGLAHLGTKGLIMIIDKIVITNNTGATELFDINVFDGTSPSSTSQPTRARDSGYEMEVDASAGKLYLYTNPVKLAGGAAMTVVALAYTTVQVDIEFVLRSEASVWVSPTSNNTAVHANFVWRERHLEPSEKR